MIDKKQVKLHFSRNASTYNQYSNVQKKMCSNLIDLLEVTSKNHKNILSILEVGSGSGYLTHKLTQLFPNTQITAVDIAPGMIEEAKLKIGSNPNVTFICGDIEDLVLTSKYDLIISNATFQWFNKIGTTIGELYNNLTATGTLCFSTFGCRTFSELKESFNLASRECNVKIPHSPGQSFYNLIELTSISKGAINSTDGSHIIDLSAKETHEFEYFNNARDFFHSIKKIGANNSNKTNRAASPSFMKKVINIYNNKFKIGNKVQVTYHCIYMKISKIKK